MSGRATNGTDNVQGPVYDSTFADYIFDVSIGTPPQPISDILDTGSDLVWTQCKTTCSNCTTQNYPLFDPAISSTYSKIGCNDLSCSKLNSHNCSTIQDCRYYYFYLTGSLIGLLGSETFTFGTEMSSVPSIVFGCSEITNFPLSNSTVIFGFSPGPLSFVSQLSSPRFSYCLDLLTTESSASTLFLGSAATINTTSGVQSTPFVDVGLDYPPYYYINLTGISLGDTLLPIPSSVFQVDPSNLTSTGTIIDSGATPTHLPQQAYDVVKQAVNSSVNLPIISTNADLDLCFDVSTTPAPSMPNMTFHFDGADMVVPYMYTDPDNNQFCLMILPSPDLSTIVGNFQQQNMLILYDLAAGMFSFAPAQCKEL